MGNTEVNLTQLGNNTGAEIDNLKRDVYSKISDLERFLRDVVTYPGMRKNFLAEVTDITFDGIKKAEDLISTVGYTPVPTRDLMPDSSSSMGKGHTFISPQLDNMENNLVSILVNAGSENIKDISSAFLSDADIAKIEQAYFEYREIAASKYNYLLGKYPTADMIGNMDWLNQKDVFIRNDFKKELYGELFRLAQGTTDWVGKQAIKIEDLHAKFTASYNSVLDKLVAANVAAYHAEVKANIAVLENDIAKANAEIDINTMRFEQRSGELSLSIRQEVARMGAYATNFSAAMSTSMVGLRSNVSTSKSVSDAYASVLASQTSRFSGVVLGRQNVE